VCVVSQDGVYVKGLFLQGAGWDQKNACLVEAEPMQLVCPMPTIHFKPVEGKRKSARGKSPRLLGVHLIMITCIRRLGVRCGHINL
jgi:hypothetical protein